ncbi:hypothetical protein [Halalkalicoccus sp. NIPERK01]|uniref:hypothetical protein n=1 Tax=Halalkalicoccus sp. NIPERK01 TaxID=3053469 RepID=UPI00256EB3BA|nr:hypothetical protein [Halalkalicoccus sp. NIPERK01]MDL5361345.1 hypothetical protein [Halalkalicoccus sp. NIPERK01]
MDESESSPLATTRRSFFGVLGAAAGAVGYLFGRSQEGGGGSQMSGEDYRVGDRDGIQALDTNARSDRYHGYHVDEGCQVTLGSGQFGVSDTLIVDPGRYFVAGSPVDIKETSVGLGTSPSPGTARWDVVHGTESGIDVEEGAEENPRPSDSQRAGVERPAPPQVEGTPLAWVWVSSESGTLTAGDVIDRRLFGHSKPAQSEPHQLSTRTPTGRERGETAKWSQNDSLTRDPPLNPDAWTIREDALFPGRRLDERFGSRTNPRSLYRFGEGLYALLYQSKPRPHEQDADPQLANQTGSLAFSRDLLSWTDSPANPIVGYNVADWHGSRVLAEALVWDDDRDQWAVVTTGIVADDETIPGIRAGGVGFSDDLERGSWEWTDDPVITVADFGSWTHADADRVYVRGLHKVDGTWYAFCNVGVSNETNREIKVGVLRSDDLLNWTEIDSNPILEVDQAWEDEITSIQSPIRWNGRWWTCYRSDDFNVGRVGIAHADQIDQKWEKADGPIISTEGTRWTGFEGPCLVPFGETWAIIHSVFEDEGRDQGRLGISHASVGSSIVPNTVDFDDDGITAYAFFDDFGDGQFEANRIPTVGGVQAGLLRPEWTVELGAPSVQDEALVTDTDGGNTVVTAPCALRTGRWQASFQATDSITDQPIIFAPLVIDRDQYEYRIQLTHHDESASTASLRVTEILDGAATDVIESSWPKDTEPHTVSLIRDSDGMIQLLFDGASRGVYEPAAADQDWIGDTDHMFLLHAADSTAMRWDEVVAW